MPARSTARFRELFWDFDPEFAQAMMAARLVGWGICLSLGLTIFDAGVIQPPLLDWASARTWGLSALLLGLYAGAVLYRRNLKHQAFAYFLASVYYLPFVVASWLGMRAVAPLFSFLWLTAVLIFLRLCRALFIHERGVPASDEVNSA